MSYFITGTDTNVGKTLISCALLRGYAERGKRVAGYKPVAAGCDDLGQNDDGRELRAASSMPLAYGQVNPYCFFPAVAPHLAAEFAGVCINLERIVVSYRELAAQADCVIVEGAGGFLLPLNESEDGADLAVKLNLPVILVVGLRLGCLNHALLTVRAIAASGLKLAGWVANTVDGEMQMIEENIAALTLRIKAPLLGVIPYYADRPDAGVVRKHLDLELIGAGHD